MPYALMTEVEVTAERDAEVLFSNGHTVPGEFADTLRESRTVGCEDGSRIAVQRTSGSYNRGRDHMWLRRLSFAVKGAKRSHRKA